MSTCATHSNAHNESDVSFQTVKQCELFTQEKSVYVSYAQNIGTHICSIDPTYKQAVPPHAHPPQPQTRPPSSQSQSPPPPLCTLQLFTTPDGVLTDVPKLPVTVGWYPHVIAHAQQEMLLHPPHAASPSGPSSSSSTSKSSYTHLLQHENGYPSTATLMSMLAKPPLLSARPHSPSLPQCTSTSTSTSAPASISSSSAPSAVVTSVPIPSSLSTTADTPCPHATCVHSLLSALPSGSSWTVHRRRTLQSQQLAARDGRVTCSHGLVFPLVEVPVLYYRPKDNDRDVTNDSDCRSTMHTLDAGVNGAIIAATSHTSTASSLSSAPPPASTHLSLPVIAGVDTVASSGPEVTLNKVHIRGGYVHRVNGLLQESGPLCVMNRQSVMRMAMRLRAVVDIVLESIASTSAAATTRRRRRRRRRRRDRKKMRTCSESGHDRDDNVRGLRPAGAWMDCMSSHVLSPTTSSPAHVASLSRDCFDDDGADVCADGDDGDDGDGGDAVLHPANVKIPRLKRKHPHCADCSNSTGTIDDDGDEYANFIVSDDDDDDDEDDDDDDDDGCGNNRGSGVNDHGNDAPVSPPLSNTFSLSSASSSSSSHIGAM